MKSDTGCVNEFKKATALVYQHITGCAKPTKFLAYNDSQISDRVKSRKHGVINSQAVHGK